MKSYKDLDVYVSTYNLTKTLTHGIKHMRRDLKIILGKDILNVCTDIILLIYKASVERDASSRVDVIEDIEKSLQVLSLKIRLSKDMNVLSTTCYAQSVESIKNIEDQCSSWKRWCKKQCQKGSC